MKKPSKISGAQAHILPIVAPPLLFPHFYRARKISTKRC